MDETRMVETAAAETQSVPGTEVAPVMLAPGAPTDICALQRAAFGPNRKSRARLPKQSCSQRLCFNGCMVLVAGDADRHAVWPALAALYFKGLAGTSNWAKLQVVICRSLASPASCSPSDRKDSSRQRSLPLFR
mmetsp:Transcript_106207/g.211014  ORF Transcript_106207/g.211014 Transcript_106207/m.211014 type:complete len:134 (+) Transcript_106207:246-647(+)